MSASFPPPTVTAPPKKPLLSDRAYNILKWLAAVALPAAGALYFSFAQIWGLPRAEEVVGSIASLNAFFGIILGFSVKSYNNSEVKYDGDFELEHTEDGMAPRLVLTSDENLDSKKQLNLRVVHK